MMRLHHLTILLLAAQLGACTTREQLLADPDSLNRDQIDTLCSVVRPVFHVHPDGVHCASVIVIGEDRFLTARHVLPEYAVGAGVSTQVVEAQIGDTAVRYHVLELGGWPDDPSDDWAVIELTDDNDVRFGPPRRGDGTAPVRYDFNGPLHLDDELYVVGFWGRALLTRVQEETFDGRLRPSVLSARLDTPPPLPTWLSRDNIYVRTNTNGSLGGTSGGAVVRLDPDGVFVVLGTFQGTAVLDLLGLELRGVHVGCRPPQAILDPDWHGLADR